MKLNALDIVSTVAGLVVWLFAGALRWHEPTVSNTLIYVLIAVGGVFINPLRMFGLIKLWQSKGGGTLPPPTT